jgi:hypothetical protein
MGLCTFCGDETTNVSRPMAGHMRFWARRNAQRVHNPREIILLPSSLLQYPMNSTAALAHVRSNYEICISPGETQSANIQLR